VRGLAGGLAGGACAGLALEYLLPLQAVRAEGGIVPPVLIGLAISLTVALFVNVLADAWLEALPGADGAGRLYHLGKFRQPHEAVIGSDKKGAVFIWVRGAEPRHATITLTSAGASLRHLAGAGQTLVNGAAVWAHLLRDGDVLEIAGTRLRYRERRRAHLLAAAKP
jgi:hypothetical protein